MNDSPEDSARQRRQVLSRLRQGGKHGVSVHDLVYVDGITRAAARVFELRADGYVIDTERGRRLSDGRTTLARYILVREPTVQIELWDHVNP